MVRDVMILMRENPFRGPLEGVGPENQDFFNEHSECQLGPKKVDADLDPPYD
jgi:hypothetical protein